MREEWNVSMDEGMLWVDKMCWWTDGWMDGSMDRWADEKMGR